jgi:hypothetical protein
MATGGATMGPRAWCAGFHWERVGRWVRVRVRKPVVWLGLVMVLAVLSTSCFSTRVTGKSAPNVAQIAPPPEILGDVLAPGPPYPFYLFERATPPADIQAASLDLVKVVARHKNLHVFALKSTHDSAAVIVVEVSIHSRWGKLMIPAERQIIQAFANNPALGKWLILLDDVDIRGEPDPVPLTAYRWTRDEVEQYKECGIPPVNLDACTAAFYEVARVVIVSSRIRGVQQ